MSSKLSERIRAARTRGGRPIGFGAAHLKDATLTRGLFIIAVGAARNGADALLLPGQSAAAQLPAAVAAAGGTPVGFQPEALTPAAVRTAEQAGINFLVFDVDRAQADALLSDTLEYVYRLPTPPPPAADLRALGSLRPVLVIAPAVPEPLPLATLLDLRKLVRSVRVPLAVAVAADAAAGSLEALRDSGIVALILPEPSAQQVEALRARIAELPERPRRRAEEESPLLGDLTTSVAEAEDEELDD